MKYSLTRFLACALAAFALASCGGGGGSGTGSGGGGGGIGGTGGALGTGSVRFALTDAPSCGYDQVNITVDRVRFNQSSSAGDSDTGWYEVALAPPQRVNLLNLVNGSVLELGQAVVPVGTYQQLRLVLSANTSASPFANSVIPTGGPETPLSTPSAQQSGLKVSGSFDTVDGGLTDLLLDFDACKSVVKAGNSGRYNLKPVISVIPRLAAIGNSVSGFISTALVSAGTSVSLQSGGLVVSATRPASTGQFSMNSVPTGTYNLVLVTPGESTRVIEGVPVTAAGVTSIGASQSPIGTGSAVVATRTVTGAVSNPSATVRVTQLLGDGSTIEVAWVPVDAATGAFTFTIPASPPLTASYSAASSANPTFSSDATAGTRYTVDAAIGSTHATQVIDTSAPVPSVNLTLPTATQ